MKSNNPVIFHRSGEAIVSITEGPTLQSVHGRISNQQGSSIQELTTCIASNNFVGGNLIWTTNSFFSPSILRKGCGFGKSRRYPPTSCALAPAGLAAHNTALLQVTQQPLSGKEGGKGKQHNLISRHRKETSEVLKPQNPSKVALTSMPFLQ